MAGFILREAEGQLPILLKNKNGGEPLAGFGSTFIF
jgi:hypothetical protein